MIPLPRAWLLTGAMLVGSAVGVIIGVLTTLLVHVSMRPDATIGLVLAGPTLLGLVLILTAGSRWVTVWGTFLLALAPGWFGVLVLIQVVNGA
ncbi:MAG: conserved hydrophobic protein [Mycobacterium sp.]|nr:conserved hydrophobic protein [Mycobacterium sp.]